MMVSDDGGRTVRRLGERSKHVDNMSSGLTRLIPITIWWDATAASTKVTIAGAFWHFKSNLPVPQFYDITTDNATPFYHVYGGHTGQLTVSVVQRVPAVPQVSSIQIGS
jgi:hypothetical protein